MFLEMLFANGGGGRLEETTLWTNPSTSSNYSGGTASLSDDIDNYDYVGVYYKFTPSSDDSTATCQYIKVADFKKDNSVTGNNTFAITTRGTSNWWARRVGYSSDTAIGISTAYAYGAAQTANNIAIPVKIVGMKLSGGGGSLSAVQSITISAHGSANINMPSDNFVISHSLDNKSFAAYCINGVLTQYGSNSFSVSYNNGVCTVTNDAATDRTLYYSYVD